MTEFQINEKKQTRACVVFPNVLSSKVQLSPEARLEEAVGLALAIDLDVAHSEQVKLREIKPGALFGQGYIDRLTALFAEKELDLLVVDASLTPIQQRNLEKKLKAKVIDRTALILEIFGERAHTREGKLQVELAHLTYQRSRLVRSWTHLERQRGGAGFLGGPGETQIELDRRIIDDKIVRIKKELGKVKKTRELQRGSRRKIPYPVVALVGYTNAGKSSVFNRLTDAKVFAKDLLFATLDPTMRRLKLPSGREIILSDTVGFISDLPHELIMSFRATLEEVLEADVIVHVRDMANPNTLLQKKDVLDVLSSLGLKNIENEENYIELLNKVDLLSPADKHYIEEISARNGNLIPTSAQTGEGMPQFLNKIEEKLSRRYLTEKVRIPVPDGKTIAWLHQNAEVLKEEFRNETAVMTIKISAADFSRLQSKLNTAS